MAGDRDTADWRDLAEAMWDFIENVTEDDPARTDRFFELRARVRTLRDAESTPSPTLPEALTHTPPALTRGATSTARKRQ